MDANFVKEASLVLYPIIYRDTEERGHLVSGKADNAAKESVRIAKLMDNLINNKET